MSSANIGIIGCGGRVRGLARQVLEHDPSIKITALCDTSAESIEQTSKTLNCSDATVYEDFRELVKAPEISWVMIGSWNCYHREHAIAALEAGIDVFCEKPLATTVEDVIAIRDAHRKSGRRFFTGFTLRYTPHYRKIHELITDGAIGDIISMEFNETVEFNHGGFIHQDWRRDTKLAGPHLLEKCCHDLDIMDWMLDGAKAQRVASFGGLDFFTPANAHHTDRIGPDPKTGRPAFQGWPMTPGNPFNDDKDIVDNQVAIIEYDNRIRATFHTSCLAGIPERRSYILGTEGGIRADLIAQKIEVQRIGWEDKVESFDTTSVGGHGGGDHVLTKQIAQCMTTDAEPPSGIEPGVQSAITSLAIEQAMTTGQVVDVMPMWAKAGMA